MNSPHLSPCPQICDRDPQLEMGRLTTVKPTPLVIFRLSIIHQLFLDNFTQQISINVQQNILHQIIIFWLLL